MILIDDFNLKISAVLKRPCHPAIVTVMSMLTCPLSQSLDWVCQHGDIQPAAVMGDGDCKIYIWYIYLIPLYSGI